MHGAGGVWCRVRDLNPQCPKGRRLYRPLQYRSANSTNPLKGDPRSATRAKFGIVKNKRAEGLHVRLAVCRHTSGAHFYRKGFRMDSRVSPKSMRVVRPREKASWMPSCSLLNTWTFTRYFSCQTTKSGLTFSSTVGREVSPLRFNLELKLDSRFWEREQSSLPLNQLFK